MISIYNYESMYLYLIGFYLYALNELIIDKILLTSKLFSLSKSTKISIKKSSETSIISVISISFVNNLNLLIL